MIKYIYQLIKGYFIYKNRVKILREGEIYLAEIEPYIISELEISNQITYSVKKLVNFFYDEIKIKSNKYDEYMITIMVLISFETEEGFRAVEKNICHVASKIDTIDYVFTQKLIEANLTELFEEYKVKTIEVIKVKII